MRDRNNETDKEKETRISQAFEAFNRSDGHKININSSKNSLSKDINPDTVDRKEENNLFILPKDDSLRRNISASYNPKLRDLFDNDKKA